MWRTHGTISASARWISSFDPATITEGTYEITFATRGRVYKVETTSMRETGDKVGLFFGPDDIHVMHKAVAEA